nr:MAG TPA: hypothetical protein [Caudoviricetes sp.]
MSLTRSISVFDYTTKVRIIFISTNIFVKYFSEICVFNICLKRTCIIYCGM